MLKIIKKQMSDFCLSPLQNKTVSKKINSHRWLSGVFSDNNIIVNAYQY